MRFSFALSISTAASVATIVSSYPLVPMPNVVARAESCGPDFCAGTNNTDPKYFCGDSRLGPSKLPMNLPLDNLVETYDRLGGLCPGAFLAKWYNTSGMSYTFPSDNGFQLNTASQPIQGNVTLPVGTKLDRFGPEFGTFLSPASAPYNQRSLPPSNLDTPPGDDRFPFNYHVYEVVKPFEVLSGPIAAWFGQPGQGTQYETYANVLALIEGGFLGRVVIRD